MPHGQASVIIVEDDASMKQALERIVRAGGFLPVTFMNAEEVQKPGVDVNVACLILDQQLPGMSGLELLRWIRLHTSTPAVVISARDELSLRNQVMSLAASRFLAKPFTGHQLLKAMQQTIEDCMSGRPRWG